MDSIAILVLGTSKNQGWNTIKDSYLWETFLLSFFKFFNTKYKYKLFVGVDNDDSIYNDKDNQNLIREFCNDKIEIEFFDMNEIENGNLSKMWNRLFKQAFEEGFDYFFQCGDDVYFTSVEMFDKCLQTLKENKNMGVTGPHYTAFMSILEKDVLKQTFVSKKHYEIFGFLFPDEIKNKSIYNWLSTIYKSSGKFFPIQDILPIHNIGGYARYNSVEQNIEPLVDKYETKLNQFIHLQNKKAERKRQQKKKAKLNKNLANQYVKVDTLCTNGLN